MAAVTVRNVPSQPTEASSMAMPEPTQRYIPHTFVWPVAAYVGTSYPLSTSHDVQSTHGAPAVMIATSASCNFQASFKAPLPANKRRRTNKRKNKQNGRSMGVAKTTNSNRHRRVPPPPPRNTNTYLMAAAAARSKAECNEEVVWDNEASVLASPGRSSASTCFGGGTNNERVLN